MVCEGCFEFDCICETLALPCWEHDRRWRVTQSIHAPQRGEWYTTLERLTPAPKPTMIGWDEFKAFRREHPEVKTGEAYWSMTRRPARILVYAG